MKKLREEIQFKSEGGLFDLVDNQIKAAYYIKRTGKGFKEQND